MMPGIAVDVVRCFVTVAETYGKPASVRERDCLRLAARLRETCPGDIDEVVPPTDLIPSRRKATVTKELAKYNLCFILVVIRQGWALDG
jgi:hypothetical protein